MKGQKACDSKGFGVCKELEGFGMADNGEGLRTEPKP